MMLQEKSRPVMAETPESPPAVFMLGQGLNQGFPHFREII